MPELEVVDSPAAPEPISTLPTFGEEASIETPEGAASETTEDAPPPESKSWSFDEWKEHPEFSGWYEDHAQELRFEGQKREYGRSQKISEAIQTKILDTATSLGTQLSQFNANIRAALDLGDPAAIGQELAKNPEALRAYREAVEASERLKQADNAFKVEPDLARVAVNDVGLAMSIIADVIGDTGLAETYHKRFAEEFPIDQGVATATFVKFVKMAIKKAKEDGVKSGLKTADGVSAETRKAEERKGQGPNTERGGVAGVPIDPDTIPTNTWIAMPIEERTRIKERWAARKVHKG